MQDAGFPVEQVFLRPVDHEQRLCGGGLPDTAKKFLPRGLAEVGQEMINLRGHPEFTGTKKPVFNAVQVQAGPVGLDVGRWDSPAGSTMSKVLVFILKSRDACLL